MDMPQAMAMETGDYFWSFWYFQIPNYLLAAVMYTLLGRLALGMLAPQGWDNYIWRSFLRLTDPILRAAAAITPGMLRGALLVPIAIFWVLVLRVLLLAVLSAAGLGPTG